jgi:hypothetical protein
VQNCSPKTPHMMRSRDEVPLRKQLIQTVNAEVTVPERIERLNVSAWHFCILQLIGLPALNMLPAKA